METNVLLRPSASLAIRRATVWFWSSVSCSRFGNCDYDLEVANQMTDECAHQQQNFFVFLSFCASTPFSVAV